MIIDCASDLHGYKPFLPGGDLLILGGDYTARGGIEEWFLFFRYIDAAPYRKKILVLGNHDNLRTPRIWNKVAEEFPHLPELIFEDELIDYEGIKIYASPWTRWFFGINPHCTHFTTHDESFLENRFSAIPDDLHILVTHGPPQGVLDSNYKWSHCGDYILRDHVWRAKPKFHIFGHIHEQGGRKYEMEYADGSNTIFMNVSIVNEHYKHCNPVTRIEI